MAEDPVARKSLKRHFRNWISWAGILLAASALFAFLLLVAIDHLAGQRNPYVGILAYLVAPFFFLAGILIAVFGAVLQWRRERHAVKVAEPLEIKIDLSRKRDRGIPSLFAAAIVIFLFVTALGSYETYQFTESVEFCGKTCHAPMNPQFVAYQHTAHASVECVACHVGPGAAAYFKTKVNGVKQLYHTVRNDFDRPIHVTADNRRPPQAICEQCHWPQRYVGSVERTYQHYLSDEKNTPFSVRLLLNVGGGEPSRGPVGGIHWHMNIANKVEYLATDKDAETIPWVRVTNAQGQSAEYRTEDFKGDPSQHDIRRMDCLDCHNRPAHNVMAPNDAVDVAMAAGRIDQKIPFAKAKVVAALTQPYASEPEALQAIATSLHAAYPDAAQADPLIAEAQVIYRQNFFPEMKTDWRTHPNNIRHKDWNGCFRCHDGNHKTADGKKTIAASDCNSCHLILAQGSGEQLKKLNADGYTFFHIDSQFSEFSCTTCHTGGPQLP